MTKSEKQGHPAGLYALFFTEMWERLAFYTMVGILLLYTTDTERGGLGMPAAEGNEIYGLYLAFVYFTPFLGGMIADRLLGYRKAVMLGGACMATGLFLMGVPGESFPPGPAWTHHRQRVFQAEHLGDGGQSLRARG